MYRSIISLKIFLVVQYFILSLAGRVVQQKFDLHYSTKPSPLVELSSQLFLRTEESKLRSSPTHKAMTFAMVCTC